MTPPGAQGLDAAARLAQEFGARVFCETFPTRLERGAGIPAAERIAYFGEAAAAQLAGTRHLILAGAVSPVTFFGYPGKPSDLVPEGCTVHTLAGPVGAAADALTALADRLAPDVVARPRRRRGPSCPPGPDACRPRPTSSARCCRSGRSSSTSPTPPDSCCRRPPPAPRPTTG